MPEYERMWMALLNAMTGSHELQRHAVDVIGVDSAPLNTALLDRANGLAPEVLAQLRTHQTAALRRRAWSVGPVTAELLVEAARVERHDYVLHALVGRREFPLDQLPDIMGHLSAEFAEIVLDAGGSLPAELLSMAVLTLSENVDVLHPQVKKAVFDPDQAPWIAADASLPAQVRLPAIGTLLVSGRLPDGLAEASVDVVGSIDPALMSKQLRDTAFESKTWLNAPTQLLSALLDLHDRVAPVTHNVHAMRVELEARAAPARARLNDSMLSFRQRVRMWDLLTDEERTPRAVALVLAEMPQSSETRAAERSLAERLLGDEAVEPMLPEAAALVVSEGLSVALRSGLQVPAWMAANPQVYLDAVLATSDAAVHEALTALGHAERSEEVMSLLADAFKAESANWSRERQHVVFNRLGPKQDQVLPEVPCSVLFGLLGAQDLWFSAEAELATMLTTARESASDKSVFDLTMGKFISSEVPLGHALGLAVGFSHER